ncbi:hypothetical protein BJX68DRAFT_139106 [Aspergillus pseudodeflectus]|uniref:Uncharacterized protein n=1 Tax=Aspergillus pseudodeflectus TaxID=176178 RepID=A0ABR4L586_9EURO
MIWGNANDDKWWKYLLVPQTAVQSDSGEDRRLKARNIARSHPGWPKHGMARLDCLKGLTQDIPCSVQNIPISQGNGGSQSGWKQRFRDSHRSCSELWVVLPGAYLPHIPSDVKAREIEQVALSGIVVQWPLSCRDEPRSSGKSISGSARVDRGIVGWIMDRNGGAPSSCA